MARRVLPSRLELNSPEGSSSEAPLKNVALRRSCTSPRADYSVVRPDRNAWISGLPPFPFLHHFAIGLFYEAPKLRGWHLASRPVLRSWRLSAEMQTLPGSWSWFGRYRSAPWREPAKLGHMAQPTLHTERLRLVPLAEEHLQFEIELDSDPEVMRYITGRALSPEEVEQAHRRRLAATDDVPGLGFWAGFADDEFVGWWILQPPHGADQPRVAGEADLGYRVLRRHWRRGYASEGAGSSSATASRTFASIGSSLRRWLSMPHRGPPWRLSG